MSKSKVFFKELMYRFPTIEQVVLGSSFFAFPFLFLIEKWGLWSVFSFFLVLFVLPWFFNVIGLGVPRGGPIWSVVKNYKTWAMGHRRDDHPDAVSDFRLMGGWFKDANGVTYGRGKMVQTDVAKAVYIDPLFGVVDHIITSPATGTPFIESRDGEFRIKTVVTKLPSPILLYGPGGDQIRMKDLQDTGGWPVIPSRENHG